MSVLGVLDKNSSYRWIFWGYFRGDRILFRRRGEMLRIGIFGFDGGGDLDFLGLREDSWGFEFLDFYGMRGLGFSWGR